MKKTAKTNMKKNSIRPCHAMQAYLRRHFLSFSLYLFTLLIASDVSRKSVQEKRQPVMVLRNHFQKMIYAFVSDGRVMLS